MAKRRTRKQKEQAKHIFTISWQPDQEKSTSASLVKRQFIIDKKANENSNRKPKRAKLLDKEVNLASIKKDLLKSLFFVSLILGSEVVLYLFWR